ncbi:MAG: hypothetical protein L3J31_03255 [Bacteroidales bacterium]|nr:hypothetical protein [Bacteroidales bacterium]
MADNLESYFKKHLSDDSPSADNWNVPSDKVWENVLPVIQKKRGLFIPWRYFYLMGGLILAALLLMLLWPASLPEIQPANQDLQTKIEETAVSPPENTQTVIREDSEEFIAEKDNSISQKISTDRKGEMAENEVSIPENTVAAGTSDKTAVRQKAKVKQIDYTVGAVYINNSNEGLAHFSEDDERENGQLTALSFRPADSIIFEEPVFLPNSGVAVKASLPETETARGKEPFDNKGKIGMGAFFAPTLTSTFLKGELNTGLMEAGNMFLYAGNWGFELKYHISNRFTLVAGIEKSEIKSWSKSLVDFGYDSSTEYMMDNGEKENTSAVPMPTPFGEIATEITYRFPGEQEIPDGEIMQSVLETHQEIRYFSIPLGIEFNIIRFSRFNWFAETGVRYNRALKDATQFTSRILHNGDEMQVVAEEMTSHPAYTENYLNFYIGTGVNYQFSKSFQISGSARYFGSITNVNLQDNMSTYVHGFSLKIGISYLF